MKVKIHPPQYSMEWLSEVVTITATHKENTFDYLVFFDWADDLSSFHQLKLKELLANITKGVESCQVDIKKAEEKKQNVGG